MRESWNERWAERTWRPYGRDDPYFAVCNEAVYRRARLDDAARASFFQSGEEHVAWVLDLVRRHAPPPPAGRGREFRRVLDFGCGVGRLLLPLAERAEAAVGVDVAPEMLDEAARNARERGLTNVSLAVSDADLSAVRGPFDLVHSFITFQHIPPARGLRLTERLVALLAPGGVGALQYTDRRDAPALRRAVHRLRRAAPGVNALANLAQGRPVREPLFPMYEYRLDALPDLVRAHGCADAHVALTDHGGHLGALLVFRKPERPEA